MECSQKLPFLFLLHALLLASSTNSFFVSSQQKGDPLIQAICKRTSNFQLCLSTLKSDPQSSNADAKGLALISLQIVLTKTNETLVAIGVLFNRTNDRGLFEQLGTCIEDYNKAVTESLPAAISALKYNNYGASKQGAEDTREDAQTCEQQFVGGSPFASQNKEVQDLSVLASEIISTLG
ncbi:hypothetical protein U1Q18_015867 [Sarracenia purpurea var. burkii]